MVEIDAYESQAISWLPQGKKRIGVSACRRFGHATRPRVAGMRSRAIRRGGKRIGVSAYRRFR
jgi:hypothetical protein